jgi:hypothetical protein
MMFTLLIPVIDTMYVVHLLKKSYKMLSSLFMHVTDTVFPVSVIPLSSGVSYRQDKTRFYLYNLRHTDVQEDIANSHSI